MSFVRGCIGVCLIWSLAANADAQDRVVLRRGGFSGRITASGTIEDYTGTEITLRAVPGDAVRRYPSAEVVAIETQQTEPHERGLALLGEQRIEEALREFELALKKEPRAWMRREILALLVQNSSRRGDMAAAGSRFLALLKSDPTTRHFRLIPLTWDGAALAAGVRGEAKTWLSGKVEAARLMGASWLLEDAESSMAAKAALRELATSTDKRIQALAQMQAWRRDVALGQLSELQLTRWQERVDALPVELKGGPSFLLGRAYAQRHDYELAAATWLWLPLVDDHDVRLTARACLEAGIALHKVGQRAEAHSLFREVRRRFADTESAEEAQTWLAGNGGKDSSSLEGN
ncbi:MAG: tetratricopeptide repeat protein [Planctomycetales bacterium]